MTKPRVSELKKSMYKKCSKCTIIMNLTKGALPSVVPTSIVVPRFLKSVERFFTFF